MSQHIEIEFKNMLTKNQYDQMLRDFAVAPEQIIRQVNHYFDTPEQHLKTIKSALRIREFEQTIECTLKEKSSEHQHLETTDLLTRDQADQMLAGNAIEAPHVKERLARFDIPLNDLQRYGTLTTDRVELPYEGGLLVFDHSFYLHCDDYEVEYETNDETFGKSVFLQFLQNYNIEPETAPKKIVRFMTALSQKG